MNMTVGGARDSGRLEAALAITAFAIFCTAVLAAAPLLIGPDGDAYRASIVAITDGHFLTLTASQAHALAAQLAACPKSTTACLSPGRGAGPGHVFEQWVRRPDGRWISEKNPGYPFLAAPFQALGLIRLAPLVYGAFACVGLYAGARRWLGRTAGLIAVSLFCSCDLAMLFAWQQYWATFTDAALVAGGTGTLLWAVLASEARTSRRTGLGLLGFLAIEAATVVRYTNIVVLGCAVVVVLALWWLRPGTVPPLARWCWLGSVVLFVAGLAAVNDLAYGGPLKTGYRPGQITFSFGAVLPNLQQMPTHLIAAMPAFLLGLAGFTLIVARRAWLGHSRLSREELPQARPGQADDGQATQIRRDFVIGIAVAAPWFAVWGLYATYTWTAQPGIGAWQSARFYLPAIGPIALLATWFLVRAPRLAHLPRRMSPAVARAAQAGPAAAVILALLVLGTWTFRSQTSLANPASQPPHCNIGQPHCGPLPPPARR